MNDQSGLAAMKRMWPRPHIGQSVKLKNGKIAEVVTVTKARDVLKSMTEMHAMLLGPKCQALYGMHWLDIYYEAVVMVPGTMMQQTITPVDVEEIVETS